MVDQPLAERLPLVSILYAFFVADTREANALDDNTDTLVIEVGHDDAEALVLLADEVLDGDFHVFEGNVGCAGGPNALAVHLAGGDTAVSTLDEKNGDAIHAWAACPDGSGEVLAPYAVGDPFLFTIDDVVLAVWRELSFAGNVCDVRASIYAPMSIITS